MLGKLVIIKDGDTLMSADNRKILLAELRAMWDRVFRTSSRIEHKSKDSSGAMTLSINGTSSLYELDSAESGARFIFCRIMDKIDDDLEDDILDKAVNQAAIDVKIESNCKLESQYEPDLLRAMKLTGGYVVHLRENSSEILNRVDMSQGARQKCKDFAKFVAYLRARPPKFQDEVQERESAARVGQQLTRLAICVAGCYSKSSVDADVIRFVRKRAIDTAAGKTLDLARILWDKWKRDGKGMEAKTLTLKMGSSEKVMEPLRNFLVKIGVLEWKQEEEPYMQSGPIRYQLTDKLRTLYESVMGDQ
jgi:hypothetical protein